MILTSGLHVEIGSRTLLEDGAMVINAGEKAGFTGRNGAGKSTLLSILTGNPSEGVRASGRHQIAGRVAFLPQSPEPLGLGLLPTVRSHLLSARNLDRLHARLSAAHVEMEEDPSTERIQHFVDAEEAFRGAGGYVSEPELERLFKGMGLPSARLEQELPTLSPGERRKVELCRVLFADAPNMILDEPTNHLDVDSKRWLMRFLSGYEGALLIVSHDLRLLDSAITKVLHLERAQITEYRGTYSQYLRDREADRVRREKVAGAQEKEIGRLSGLADSMRHSTAKRARIAKTLDKRISRLEAGKVERAETMVVRRYKLPPPPRAPRTLLTLAGICKSYGEHQVFEGIGFSLERGHRLAVIGLNGAGKSTLLRIVAGVTVPSKGEVVVAPDVAIGLFEQEHGNLDLRVPVVANINGPGVPNQEARRRVLGAFGLSGDIAFQRTGTLSGGERTKVSLAQLTSGAHNLLLLDEPTNNLDPASREAVTSALRGWEGSIILVSHDTEFVSALTPTHSLLLPEGRFDYWREELLELVELA